MKSFKNNPAVLHCLLRFRRNWVAFAMLAGIFIMTPKQLKIWLGDYVVTPSYFNQLLKEINSTKEIWKDIEGLGEVYQVSNLGRIKSKARIISDGRRRKERLLVLQKNKYGYSTVFIRSKNKNVLVHRLVAKAFIPNHENKPYVNHKNGIKHDSRKNNLEWCTPRENTHHAIVTGLMKSTPKGEKNKLYEVYNNHFSKPVIQLDKNNVSIKEWPSSHEVKRVLGICNRAISLCALGKKGRHTAGGFKWKYKTKHMQTLQQIFNEIGNLTETDHGGNDKGGKIHTYLETYDKLFEPFRNGCNIMEIGLASGDSILLWDKYFANSKIFGIDLSIIFTLEKTNSTNTIYLHAADATKPDFLKYLRGLELDICIDDASHQTQDQIVTFNLMKPYMKKGSIYIIEDILALDIERKKFEALHDNCEIIDMRDNGRFDNVLIIYRF